MRGRSTDDGGLDAGSKRCAGFGRSRTVTARGNFATCFSSTTTRDSAPSSARRSRSSTSRSRRPATRQQRRGGDRPQAAGRDRARRPHARHATGSSSAAAEARRRARRGIGVVLLTGDRGRRRPGRAAEAGADAFLRKPFSPLQLLAVVENARRRPARRPVPGGAEPGAGEEQLLLYARDLAALLEIERGQRRAAPERLPGDRRGARERARVEGHRHPRALRSASSATRCELASASSSDAARTTRASSTASCSTTSARSASPTGILRKPGP